MKPNDPRRPVEHMVWVIGEDRTILYWDGRRIRLDEDPTQNRFTPNISPGDVVRWRTDHRPMSETTLGPRSDPPTTRGHWREWTASAGSSPAPPSSPTRPASGATGDWTISKRRPTPTNNSGERYRPNLCTATKRVRRKPGRKTPHRTNLRAKGGVRGMPFPPPDAPSAPPPFPCEQKLRNTWTFVDRGTRSDPTPEPAIAALVARGSLPVSMVLTNCHPIPRLAPPPG